MESMNHWRTSFTGECIQGGSERRHPDQDIHSAQRPPRRHWAGVSWIELSCLVLITITINRQTLHKTATIGVFIDTGSRAETAQNNGWARELLGYTVQPNYSSQCRSFLGAHALQGHRQAHSGLPRGRGWDIIVLSDRCAKPDRRLRPWAPTSTHTLLASRRHSMVCRCAIGPCQVVMMIAGCLIGWRVYDILL